MLSNTLTENNKGTPRIVIGIGTKFCGKQVAPRCGTLLNQVLDVHSHCSILTWQFDSGDMYVVTALLSTLTLALSTLSSPLCVCGA